MQPSSIPFSNNLVFAATMQSNPDLCRRVIERILGFKIDEAVSVIVEETISSVHGKSVRLDVTLRTDDEYINVEMQCVPEPSMGRRMRFYQARADVSSLDKGEDYDALPELYIIFICTFDHFGHGDPLYEFEFVCRKRPLVDSGAGIHFVVVNTRDFEACDSEKLRSLLRFIKTDIPDEKDGLIMELDKAKKQATATLHIGLLSDPEMDERVRKRYYTKLGREEVLKRAKALRDSGLISDEALSALLEESYQDEN